MIFYFQNIYKSGFGHQRLTATDQFRDALAQFREDVNEYAYHAQAFIVEVDQDLSFQLNATLQDFHDKLFMRTNDDLNDWKVVFFGYVKTMSVSQPFIISPALTVPYMINVGHTFSVMQNATIAEEGCYKRMLFQDIVEGVFTVYLVDIFYSFFFDFVDNIFKTLEIGFKKKDMS